VSRYDLPHGLRIRDISSWLGDRCDVLLTAGLSGGLMLQLAKGRIVGGRRYRAIPARAEVDPTGAGDTMLAGVVAARIAGSSDAARSGRDLNIGALAASLLVEGPGLGSVPVLGRLRDR